jgi:hypothetical protein
VAGCISTRQDGGQDPHHSSSYCTATKAEQWYAYIVALLTSQGDYEYDKYAQHEPNDRASRHGKENKAPKPAETPKPGQDKNADRSNAVGKSREQLETRR